MGYSLKWLELVAAQHKDWVAIINSFGEYRYAEDIVQEMYFVLIKYASEEKVIRNSLIIDEGDAFNDVLLDKSINNIKSRGYFKTVKPFVNVPVAKSLDLPIR